ncbi:LysE family translocator [Micromonospora soli]|uniref:LysE family translocator n=1 Tax=Micromonospora sp. NBRC 110009 TaxID=3061627 RepID=UPI0026737FEF|nr:LysE family translocator [Micromonospora sp. NBRC 110009]WKT97160.1 LysE family translocator [Micromonospora sp. NBRC 110009]
MPIHLPVFVATTWLLAMLPGAGQALMLRQTLDGGRPRAWASIAGTCTGLLIWTTAAAAGLSAVLLANPHAYAAVRVAGGALLAVLGVTTLLSLRRPAPSTSDRPAERTGRGRAYAAGLATNLGNPKAGVFAVSLLPQFLTADGPVFLSSLALGALWAAVTGCWYLLFTWAVDRGRTLVSTPAVHRRLQLVTGCALLCIGAGVAAGA